MAIGSDFDVGPKKISICMGPPRGAGFKMHVRDRRSNTFFHE